jgi:hypothetical protein
LQLRLPAFEAPAVGLCSSGGEDFVASAPAICSSSDGRLQLHRHPLAAPPHDICSSDATAQACGPQLCNLPLQQLRPPLGAAPACCSSTGALAL